jgi:signal transduction histidine kinase
VNRRTPRLRPLDRALLCTAGGVSLLVFGIVLFAPSASWAAEAVAAIGGAGLAALGGIAWGERRLRRMRDRHATEVVRLRAAIAHRDRLASLGLSTAGIVHDLRGPVSALQMGVELLSAEGLPTETQARVQVNLAASVDRLRAQVDGLLTHARPDGGTAADPAEAAELAHRLVDLGGRRRISVNLPEAPRRVRLAQGGTDPGGRQSARQCPQGGQPGGTRGRLGSHRGGAAHP